MIYPRTPDNKTPNASEASFGYDPIVDPVDSPEVQRAALIGVELGKMAYDAVMVESELQEGLRSAEEGVIDTPLTPEDKEKERLKRLFAFPEARGRDRFGNDLDMRLRVTAQSAEDAAMAYRYLDDAAVRDMIRKYAGDAWRENEMAKVLRENDDLRFEVGEYLLGKLETLTHLPSRMYSDMTKNTGEEGYDRNLKSKEYATLIALSMLDGTFKNERASGDPIEMKHGTVNTGQHRYTALRVLGLEQSPLAHIKKN